MNMKIRVYLFEDIDYYYIYIYIFQSSRNSYSWHDKKGEKSGEKHIVDAE